MTETVDQPSALPTNKLTASAIATAVVMAIDTYGEGIIGEWLGEIPVLATKPATVACLAILVKVGIPFAISYWFVKDKPNVTAPQV